MQNSTRNVYLISYDSPLFPAHWVFFVPSTDEPEVGTAIHVVGDAANGFEHDFKRNYDRVGSQRKQKYIFLGRVASTYVDRSSASLAEPRDKDPTNTLEEIALSIPAPQKSLVSTASASMGMKVPIKNCQSWMKEYVAALVARNVLDGSAIEVLENAPKN